MEIKKIGKYRLLKDHQMRGSISIRTFSAGVIVEITQIDKSCRKVYGKDFPDWQSWDLPVEELEQEENKKGMNKNDRYCLFSATETELRQKLQEFGEAWHEAIEGSGNFELAMDSIVEYIRDREIE